MIPVVVDWVLAGVVVSVVPAVDKGKQNAIRMNMQDEESQLKLDLTLMLMLIAYLMLMLILCLSYAYMGYSYGCGNCRTEYELRNCDMSRIR